MNTFLSDHHARSLPAACFRLSWDRRRSRTLKRRALERTSPRDWKVFVAGLHWNSSFSMGVGLDSLDLVRGTRPCFHEGRYGKVMMPQGGQRNFLMEYILAVKIWLNDQMALKRPRIFRARRRRPSQGEIFLGPIHWPSHCLRPAAGMRAILSAVVPSSSYTISGNCMES